MKNASMQFRKPSWQDWHGNEQQIPSGVQRVASAFVDLQEETPRITITWSATEVQATLNTARSAFQDWQSVRSDSMAGNYLLAMLLKKH